MGVTKELFMEIREREDSTPSAPLTKSSQIELAEMLTNKVELGEVDPLKTFIQLRSLKTFIQLRSLETSVKIALDKIKGRAIEEGQKLNKGGEKIIGVNCSLMNGRRMYDYSNDSVWNDLKAKMKEREDFLKGLKEPMSDMEGVISCPPIIKYCEETLTLKFD